MLEGMLHQRWLRSGSFAVAFMAAGFAARTTIVDGPVLSMVWPAAGVAVLWFLAQRASLLSVDSLLLVLAAFTVNWSTGSGPLMACVLVVANLSQTLLTVHLLRRWCPSLWGCGGSLPLDRPRQLGGLLLAASVGSLLGALAGAAGLLLVDGAVEAVGVLVWWGRNLSGILALTILGLLAGFRLLVGRSGLSPRIDTAARRTELAALVVLTIALFGAAFTLADLPLTFPLLAPTVWVALRFSTLVATVHSVVVGGASVRLTLLGAGPFATAADATLDALFAQMFLVLVLGMGLTLATARDEHASLSKDLAASEHAAAAQARLLGAIIASMNEGVVVVEEGGSILLTNPAASRHTGGGRVPDTGPEVGMCRLDGTILAPEERPSYLALRGEEVVHLDVLLDPNGRRRVLSISATPLPAEAVGETAQAVLVFQDVTDDRAERADLTAFAGAIAHDLQNPLTVIEGWAETLQDALTSGTPLGPREAGNMVGHIHRASVRMNALIEDLLSYTVSRDRPLERSDLDLATMVREVAMARGAVGLVTVGQFPLVHADPVLVRQLVDNLIGNALKYVSPGTAPRVEVAGSGADGGWVRVAVTDHGIGIPPGHHDLVFQQFQRAHAADYPGTGLGLAICQRIVDRHGGDIRAMPGPSGVGTRIEFTLPLAGPRLPSAWTERDEVAPLGERPVESLLGEAAV